jgi:hypothetical protein
VRVNTPGSRRLLAASLFMACLAALVALPEAYFTYRNGLPAAWPRIASMVVGAAALGGAFYWGLLRMFPRIAGWLAGGIACQLGAMYPVLVISFGETMFGHPGAARYWLVIWAMDSIPAGWLPFLVGIVAGGGMRRLLPAPPS